MCSESGDAGALVRYLNVVERSVAVQLHLLSSPAVLGVAGPQGAACQGVEVWRVTQSPGGHREPLAGGGGAQTADRSVQTALAEARGLEGSPRVCHCRNTRGKLESSALSSPFSMCISFGSYLK